MTSPWSVVGQTVHSPPGTSETMFYQTLLNPPPPFCPHSSSNPAYQRFVSDQEPLGQRTLVRLEHHIIHLQWPSLICFFIANAKWSICSVASGFLYISLYMSLFLGKLCSMLKKQQQNSDKYIWSTDSLKNVVLQPLEMPPMYYYATGFSSVAYVKWRSVVSVLSQNGLLLLELWDDFRLYTVRAANAIVPYSNKVISALILFPSDHIKEEVSVWS